MIYRNRYFWLLAVFVFCVLSFSRESVRNLRTTLISWISLAENHAVNAREFEKLQTENQLMRLQLERLKNWIFEDHKLNNEKNELLSLLSNSDDPFFKRRANYLATMIYRQMHAVPAQVIFRDPSPWSSSLWLNVGQRDNRALGCEVVAKDSPVVFGKTIVGIVEEVTEKKCLVRLITDRSLSPSVRAVRGGEQNRVVSEKLNFLIKLLEQREDLHKAKEIAQMLAKFRGQIDTNAKELYLAKGQMNGATPSLLRVSKKTLKGVGFNYDFSDEEGPARNLRTGAYPGGQEPLIKVGDLLVTTGSDGIFPPDFQVGIVSKIFPLHEGGCSYDLEAEMLAPNLNTLTEVFVLPPL